MAVTLAVLIMFPAAAQSSRISSNTLGLFNNDADLFMDPNDYKSVKFDQWFAELQYARSQDLYKTYYNDISVDPLKSNILGAGYARYLGDTYLGLYYEGNIIEGNWSSDTTNIAVYDRLDVLAGNDKWGGITGILGVQYRNVDDSDWGGITIGAGWGKNFTLGNGSLLKPQAGLIFSKGFIPEGEPLLETLEDVQSILLRGGYSDPSLKLEFTIAGGAKADWELPPGETAKPVVSFGYSFAAVGLDGFLPAAHTVSGVYKQTYDLSDQFSFGFGGGADVGLIAGTLKSGSFDMDVTRFVFTPNAAAGFAYQFKSPFSINAGIGAGYSMGVWSAKPKPGVFRENNKNFLGPFELQTRAGGSFQPLPNLALDFSFYATGGDRYYNIILDNLRLAVRYKK